MGNPQGEFYLWHVGRYFALVLHVTLSGGYSFLKMNWQIIS